MNEMLERVAKALFEKTDPGLKWSNATEFMKAETRDFARAAVGAMREPTDDMVEVFAEAAADAREAAREDNRRMNRTNPNALAECQWFPPAYRAMIDALLAPTEPAKPPQWFEYLGVKK